MKRTNRKTISRRYLRPRWYFLSQDKHGTLYIDGLSVKYLAEKFDTPLQILVEREVRNRLRRFKASFPYSKLRPQYASKCNSNIEILKIVREEGFELDASSVGEIILALLADFKPDQITFTNLYKTEHDILFAAKVGVSAITTDSIEEIKKIAAIGSRIKKKIRLFVRINPMIELGAYTTKKHQYGVPIGDAKKALNLAMSSPYIDLLGLHFHGGYINDPKVYFITANKLLKLAKHCFENGTRIKYIDLGGGFPIEYNSKKVFQPEEMGQKFVRHFEALLEKYGLPHPTLIFEPGKFIVGNSGIGLVKVIAKKDSGKTDTIVVNGSGYSLVPDVLFYNPDYDILPATKLNKPQRQVYNIAGCTCDSIDILGKSKYMPRLQENDLLAIMDIGAYSNVLASNFNSLKRPPIVMIKEDGSIKLIRRRDRYSEMFAPELDVLKVADPKELKRFYDLSRVNINKMWGSEKKKQKSSRRWRRK